MDNADLIKAILGEKSDEKRREIIINERGGLKLYRYRRYNGTQNYEKEATATNQINATRTDKLDDDEEGSLSQVCKKDIFSIASCLNMVNKYEARKELLNGNVSKVMNRLCSETESKNVFKIINNPKLLYTNDPAAKRIKPKQMEKLLKEYRKFYAISCFTENDPLNNKAMWNRYSCNDNGVVGGFCFEYDIEDFCKQGYVICPVYYQDNASYSSLCKTFDYHIESIFLHKNESGFDKYAKDKEPISWEQQMEWRIVRKNDDEKEHLYLDKAVVPRKLYYLKGTPHISDILNLYQGKMQEVTL